MHRVFCILNLRLRIILKMIATYFFIGVIILIFPIPLTINLYYDKEYKKIYSVFTVFKRLRLLGGYISIKKDGLFYHISKNKALHFPYKLPDFNKTFKLFNEFKLESIKFVFEIGEYDLFKPFMIANGVNILCNTLSQILSVKKSNFKLNNITVLYQDLNVFKIACNVTLVFNAVAIIITIIKYFLEKIVWVKILKLMQL